MPQARATHALAHFLLLAVGIDHFMHFDNRSLTPHLHVTQIDGSQGEQSGFVRKHRPLHCRQCQSRSRLVRVRFLTGSYQNLRDIRRIGRHRIRTVLLRIGQRDGRLLAQMLDIEGLAGAQRNHTLGELRWAAFHVRAANILIALLGGSQFRAA